MEIKCEHCKRTKAIDDKNIPSSLTLNCDYCGRKLTLPIKLELDADADNIGLNINKIHLTKEKTTFILQELELKCEIPFPEWFLIMRDLKCLKNFTFIDGKNKCAAMFKPYINKNLFDVSIELAPIHIGKRFEQMNSLN